MMAERLSAFPIHPLRLMAELQTIFTPDIIVLR
jgi:hypothetical protein